jgi:hypothetical protein
MRIEIDLTEPTVETTVLAVEVTAAGQTVRVTQQHSGMYLVMTPGLHPVGDAGELELEPAIEVAKAHVRHHALLAAAAGAARDVVGAQVSAG